MVPINVQYDPSFLDEEVREGHLVSSKMKKLWLVELDILNKFIQICDKHNIKYFADAGTLLGAVRHNGFIPWDDDIDVILMRDEFDKFVDVVKYEIQYPYYIDTSGYMLVMKRLDTTKITARPDGSPLNGNKIPTEKPLCISIDIFCADFCPEDYIERAKFYKVVQHKMYEYINTKSRYNGKRYVPETTKDELDILKIELEKKFKESKELLRTYKNTKYIFNDSFCKTMISVNQLRYAEDYEDEVFFPFEMLTLRCPKGYARELNVMYTRRTGVPWNIPKEGLGYHKQDLSKTLIDIDKPYTEYTIPLKYDTN